MPLTRNRGPARGSDVAAATPRGRGTPAGWSVGLLGELVPGDLLADPGPHLPPQRLRRRLHRLAQPARGRGNGLRLAGAEPVTRVLLDPRQVPLHRGGSPSRSPAA